MQPSSPTINPATPLPDTHTDISLLSPFLSHFLHAYMSFIILPAYDHPLTLPLKHNSSKAPSAKVFLNTSEGDQIRERGRGWWLIETDTWQYESQMNVLQKRNRRVRGGRTRYCLLTVVQGGKQLPGEYTGTQKHSRGKGKKWRPCCVPLTLETGLRG